jgi:hypothetical protein
MRGGDWAPRSLLSSRLRVVEADVVAVAGASTGVQSAAAHAGVSFKEAQARLAAGERAEMSDDDDDECGPTHIPGLRRTLHRLVVARELAAATPRVSGTPSALC